MKTFSPLFKIFKSFTGEILLSVALGIAAIGAGIGLMGTSAYIIASAALHPSISTLQVAIVGVRFFGLSRGVFRYLERIVSHSVNLRVVARLREDFYRRIEPGAPANLVSYRSGDLLQRVIGDLETLENFYVRVIAPFVVAAVVVLGVSLFVGGYAVELGILLAAGMILTGFLQPLVSLLLTRKLARQQVQARAQSSAKLVELLQSLEDLQAGNAQDHFYQGLRTEFQQSAKTQVGLGWLTGVNNGMVFLLTNLTLLALLVLAIPLVNQGSINGVTLAVVALVAISSFEAVNPMSAAMQQFNASQAAAQRLFSIGEKELKPPSEQDELRNIKSPLIRFDSVSLVYPLAKEKILDQITFDLPYGKKIAVVGSNGAGKSSLVSMLLGFVQPAEGNLFLLGEETLRPGAEIIRPFLAVQLQSPYLFSDSVRKNLLLAAPEATDTRLLQVLAMVGLSEWVQSLPQGLDTWIGEHGEKMSGGERQRLSLARVFLQDKPFLILDEPTASLDAVNSQRVINAFLEEKSEAGMLVITHDLHWFPVVDEILVMEQGKIIERGTYQALLSQNSRFRKLYQQELDRLVEQ
ncbi:MAG TPA: thiol reductant ABC exporter subunit CydC [Anaerolineaceae bacterium]|nr:thiol reductant ABC exporter subunit CydC [Anaerolineaceae bacterium]